MRRPLPFHADAAEAVQDAAALGPGPTRVAVATDVVAAEWCDTLRDAGELSVPGEFSRAALERSGVDPARLRVVAPVLGGFALDTPARRLEDTGAFVFLAIVDWTRASGWDVLARAFAAEFATDEDVSLALLAWSSLEYTAPVIAETLVAELEAAGHNVDDLPEIILDVSAEHVQPDAGVYRGADCFVSPARGDAWGRRLLEATACGVPVIATAWAAGADLGCSHPLGATVVDVDTIAARELPHLDGGRWAEPDGAELRRHLRAVFEGRPPQPPAAIPVAVDRAVARPRRGADPREVSFVLQGPVERFGAASTVRACAAIRAHFPGAEIVVSTWEGADTAGLDCDVLVESADPGSVGGSFYNPNTNRQIVSSLAGIRAGSRPLVVKARSDMQFLSNSLLSHWGEWEERTDELRLFERRVLVPDVFTRRPTYLAPFPLHPSDWSYFGTRGDLETLFDVPHMSFKDSRAGRVEGIGEQYWPYDGAPSYTPEQWIWCQALRKVAPELALANVFDLTPETLHATELSFANNLAILDTYRQYGVWCPKYPWPNRLYQDFTLIQHAQWRALYEIHCVGVVAPDVGDVLAELAAGGIGTWEQATALRAAGHSYEAQLLETALAGHRFRRDSTTGGHVRWFNDLVAAEEAREVLTRRAAAAVRHAARPAGVVA
jgi:hypothetical protein